MLITEEIKLVALAVLLSEAISKKVSQSVENSEIFKTS